MGAYIGVRPRIHPDQQFLALLSRHVRDPADRRRVQCVFTNTVPTGPYRGAGRPEANYALERAGRRGGARHRHRPGRLRRRNLIPQGDPVQDRGRHDLRLRRFRRRSSTRRWRSRTTPSSRSAGASRRKRGKLRGIGVSCFLEHAGGAADREARRCCFPGGDKLVLGIGVQRPARATPRCSAPDGREARHSGGADRASARRHRSRIEGHPVGRLALDHDGRQRAHRAIDLMLEKGKADRRRAAGSRGVRRRLSRRAISRSSAPTGASRCSRSPARQGDGRRWRDARHQGDRRHAADLPERLPHRRGRDRSGDRRGRDRRLHGGRRLPAWCSTTRSSRARCSAAWRRGSGRR